jgi:tetratricopeptide (TPR) repeat protein
LLKPFKLYSQRLIVFGLLSAMFGCVGVKTNGPSANELSTISKAAIGEPSLKALPTSQTDEQGVSDPEETLPNAELDAELLEALLIADLASYQQKWGQASEKAYSAAVKTRDFRLARLASLYAMRDKDFSSAIGSAKLWRELQANSGDAQITLVLAFLGSGDAESAMAIFAERRGDKLIDEHIKEVGGILVRQDNQSSALDVATRYVNEFPDSAQVALSAAYVAQTFKDDDLTGLWLEKALAARPGWGLAAQMKSNLLLRKGEVEERRVYIENFIKAHPEANAMRVSFAAELAKKEDFDKALEQMQIVIANDVKNVGALSYAAALAEQLKQTDLADKYYRKAIVLDPANDEARWALARRAIQSEDYARAELHYQKIVSEGSYFRAQLQVANMRYHTKGLKGAIDTLRALDPKTEAEYVDRATARHYLLLQDRMYDEAYSAINETLAFLPDNVELVYARALVAAELNDVSTAEDDLRSIIGKFPEHANALNALGYTLADQTDRYVEAKNLILKALSLRPNDAHILDSMGWVYYRLKDYDQAVEFLQRAYDKTPEVEVAAHLGEVLWEKGETERAKTVWKEAFEKDNENPLLKKTIDRYGIVLSLPN